MKIAFFLFGAVALALLTSACTVAESSAEDVGRQFQQGVTGGGQIVPNDPMGDSFGPSFQ